MSLEKKNSAKKALEFVKNGMVLGLGSGTTVHEFLKLLGEKIKKEKLNIAGVPTSYDTQLMASAEGIPLLQPDQVNKIDIAIDGADVASKDFLIKGGGGAMTREKIIAYNSEEFLVLIDEGKLKRKFPIPIEVIPFAASFVAKTLSKKGKVSLRFGDRKVGPVITDNGNFIIDFEMEIKNPKELEKELNNIPGVVENGIFTKFSKLIIGTKTGSRIL